MEATKALRRVPRLGRALFGGSLGGSATLAMAFSGGSVGAALKHQSTTKLVRAAYSKTVDAKTAKVTRDQRPVQRHKLVCTHF